MMWYINTAKNNLRIIESILVTTYKFVLGLPKILQMGFVAPSSKTSDKFICKSFQLCRGRIINKIKLIQKKS